VSRLKQGFEPQKEVQRQASDGMATRPRAELRRSEPWGLFPRSRLWECPGSMRISRLLQFLFASLISIGLAIAPLAFPAVAGNGPDGAATRMAVMQMTDMSDDMPCCPEKQKQGDCQDCPLIAICMLKVLHGGPVAGNRPLGETKSRVLRPLDEPVVAGLTRPPPDQPPRTVI
jgi:hypothetical protein